MLAVTYAIAHDAESRRGSPVGSYVLAERAVLHMKYSPSQQSFTCRRLADRVHTYLAKQMVLEHIEPLPCATLTP